MTERIKRGPEDKSKFATQEVNANITIRDRRTHEEKEYAITELETENTQFNRVDIATATVVPTTNDYVTPRFEDDVEITINDEIVFSGFVGEVSHEEYISFEIKCFSDIRKLKTTSINVGTEEKFVMASDMLRNQILPEAGIYDYEIHLDDLPTLSIDRRSIKEGQSWDQPVEFEATQTSAMTIIDRLAKHTNSVWWFDNSGTFHFGDPRTEIYELSYVRDASAGKTTPPYRSVRVVGSGGASQNSWSGKNMIPRNPVQSVRTLENVLLAEEREQIVAEASMEDEDSDEVELSEDHEDVYRVKKGEVTEPVYLYRDKSIDTQDQADAIANALANELVQQTRQGWVEIVGWAEIEPFDVIEMPDFLGGEQYLVQGVEHTLDSSDGFVTEIQCGGLVHSGNTTINEGAFAFDG